MNRARRIQGVVLATLLVASQASAWLHAAAVAHATCLEHGEAIHAGASALDLSASTVESSAPVVQGDDAVAYAHEHCDSGALLRFRDVALPAPVGVAFVPTVLTSLVAGGSNTAVVAADVYRIAPKTSPPRAGV